MNYSHREIDRWMIWYCRQWASFFHSLCWRWFSIWANGCIRIWWIWMEQFMEPTGISIPPMFNIYFCSWCCDHRAHSIWVRMALRIWIWKLLSMYVCWPIVDVWINRHYFFCSCWSACTRSTWFCTTFSQKFRSLRIVLCTLFCHLFELSITQRTLYYTIRALQALRRISCTVLQKWLELKTKIE